MVLQCRIKQSYLWLTTSDRTFLWQVGPWNDWWCCPNFLWQCLHTELPACWMVLSGHFFSLDPNDVMSPVSGVVFLLVNIKFSVVKTSSVCCLGNGVNCVYIYCCQIGGTPSVVCTSLAVLSRLCGATYCILTTAFTSIFSLQWQMGAKTDMHWAIPFNKGQYPLWMTELFAYPGTKILP